MLKKLFIIISLVVISGCATKGSRMTEILDRSLKSEFKYKCNDGKYEHCYKWICPNYKDLELYAESNEKEDLSAIYKDGELTMGSFFLSSHSFILKFKDSSVIEITEPEEVNTDVTLLKMGKINIPDFFKCYKVYQYKKS